MMEGESGEWLSRLPRLKSKLDLRAQFEPVEGGLAEVEERIRHQARAFDPGIVGYIEYACASRGKRIRPALALLGAHATGGSGSGHLDLAVVVELIHLATLVHDDIMDGAVKRRGQPTAYAKWGAELSVLLGDCLFSHALRLCTQFPTTDVSRRIADAASEVCSGEILQTQRRFDLQLTIPEYIGMIRMKTAALFRVSTELSAFLNNSSSEVVGACREYGEALGIAYQIYDDCLDIVGIESNAGKTLGTDLAKGKLTLPLLHVLKQLDDDGRERLSEMIVHGSGDDRTALLEVVLERGGLRASVRKIQSYLDSAIQALGVLPDSRYRTLLREVPLALQEHMAGLE
jgi:octaprenyl-diphosphate synthase